MYHFPKVTDRGFECSCGYAASGVKWEWAQKKMWDHIVAVIEKPLREKMSIMEIELEMQSDELDAKRYHETHDPCDICTHLSVKDQAERIGDLQDLIDAFYMLPVAFCDKLDDRVITVTNIKTLLEDFDD